MKQDYSYRKRGHELHRHASPVHAHTNMHTHAYIYIRKLHTHAYT